MDDIIKKWMCAGISKKEFKQLKLTNEGLGYIQQTIELSKNKEFIEVWDNPLSIKYKEFKQILRAVKYFRDPMFIKYIHKAEKTWNSDDIETIVLASIEKGVKGYSSLNNGEILELLKKGLEDGTAYLNYCFELYVFDKYNEREILTTDLKKLPGGEQWMRENILNRVQKKDWVQRFIERGY